jgi:hypothetical protein
MNLTPTEAEAFPVFSVPAGTPPITDAMVADALNEEFIGQELRRRRQFANQLRVAPRPTEPKA